VSAGIPVAGEAIFGRDGDVFVPTGHARGPWDPGAQHGGAPSALIARAVEALAPDMRLARLTVELLGAVPLAPLAVSAEIVKAGRRFQLAEATLSVAGSGVVVCRARAALLRRGDEAGVPPGDRPAPLVDGPLTAERNRWNAGTEGFGQTGMDLRFVAGDFVEAGPARTWLRLARPLVDGEEASPVQIAVAAADFGNGVSRVLDWDRWLFVNTDLTVHLHRDPEGEWIALDARTAVEPNGSGLAVSDLHDERGPIGVALQSLFVAPR
jgi:hypothetical protein